MYLLQNSARVNNRKWNLGRMGCGCSARGIATPPTKRIGGLRGLGDYTYQSALDAINASQNIIATRGQSGQTIIIDQNTWLSMDPVTGEIWQATSSGNVSLGTGPVAPPSATPPLTPPSTSTTTSSPTQTPSNFLKSGSVLTYSVQWASSLLNVANPSQILATIKPILSQQWGIEIDSSSIPSTVVGQALGFTITVHTTRDYGQAQDIKAIIDGAIANAGRQVTASQILLGAASPGLDLSSFLSSYALPIGLGVGALFLAKEL